MNNLFNFATSELSQDAMLCWLINWADSRQQKISPKMHSIGTNFLNSLITNWNIKTNSQISLPGELDIKIYKQLKHSDIVIIINDQIFLCIEDKISTNARKNQLNDYYQTFTKDISYETMDKIFIYFKSEYFMPDYELQDSEFIIYDLPRLVEFLNSISKPDCNDILYDFYNYIMSKEKDASSFLTTPIQNWSGKAIQKFYTELATKPNDAEGGFVSNPAGGFYGRWWGWLEISKIMKIYLQLETSVRQPVVSRLCFKMTMLDKNLDMPSLRENWYKCLLSAAKIKGLDIEKIKWTNGKFMTVARITGDARITGENGIIDMDKTTGLLNQAYNTLVESTSCLKQS